MLKNLSQMKRYQRRHDRKLIYKSEINHNYEKIKSRIEIEKAISNCID